jgi:hypothetical protein
MQPMSLADLLAATGLGSLANLVDPLLLGLLIGALLVRQPRLQAAIQARRQPHAVGVESARHWSRQVPGWSLALQGLGTGAMAGVMAAGVAVIFPAVSRGPLAFLGDMLGGLTAGLLIWLLAHLLEPREAHGTPPPSPSPTETA